MKTIFTYHQGMEGSVSLGSSHAPGGRQTMTRCECAEVPFDEVARSMREGGLSLEEASWRTGCGRLCTACLPDLRAHVGQGR
jgi:NAD(P)H-nitrite reductase large subunit